jgi:hypothetical protein
LPLCRYFTLSGWLTRLTRIGLAGAIFEMAIIQTGWIGEIVMAECTLAETGERLTRFGHALNRESIRVAARECWRAGRLIERRPAAADMFREYLKHPKDDDDLDDDALDAELDRLFLAD